MAIVRASCIFTLDIVLARKFLQNQNEDKQSEGTHGASGRGAWLLGGVPRAGSTELIFAVPRR